MSNPNDSNFSYDIYGGIDEELDAAYARNAANGLAQTTRGETVQSVLSNVAEEPDTIPEASPEFTVVVRDAMRASNILCDSAGFGSMNVEKLLEADIDFERLQRAYEVMEQLGLAPELVIAPDLTLQNWKYIYEALKSNETVNPDGRIRGNGLAESNKVRENWDALRMQEYNVRVGDSMDYQIALIPGTDKPPLLKLNYDALDDTGVHNHAFGAQTIELGDVRNVGAAFDSKMHPTINTYLMLQATRLLHKRDLIDVDSVTWLEGVFGDTDDSWCAPLGTWSAGAGSVVLDHGKIRDAFNDQGIRIPVWG